MRIEPVFLLAPKPKPPSIPTRRAFLLAGGTFLAGIGLGGACGYAAGASRSGAGGGSGDADDVDEPLVPSGDSDLDELRRLAVKAPIDELMEKALVFSNLVRGTYPDDPILWRGIKRIAEALVQGYRLPDRRRAAIWVAQIIENGNPKFAQPLQDLGKQLRNIR